MKPTRLLIVEPDKVSVNAMTRYLRSDGFEVQSVDSGKKAVDCASRDKHDLIVVDIQLPDINSFELSGTLRAQADTSDLPVVFVGASPAIEARRMRRKLREALLALEDLPSLSERIKEVVARCRRRRGIEEALAKEAAPIRPEGAQEVTAQERARLHKAGGNLEQVDWGAKDPVLRGALNYLNLLESSFTTAQVSKMLQVNESRVRQRLTSRPPTLYGIKRDAEWLIPAFQFEGRVLVPNVGRVIAKLDADLHPLSVWRWFTTPDADLANEDSPVGGYSPREWLLQGFPVEMAEGLAASLHLS